MDVALRRAPRVDWAPRAGAFGLLAGAMLTQPSSGTESGDSAPVGYATADRVVRADG